MIDAVFFKNNNLFYYFKIIGHADYNLDGADIVCSAVSSVVEMTINAIKNILNEECDVKIDSSKAFVSLKLSGKIKNTASLFIEALCAHLLNISAEFSSNIKVKIEFIEE